MTRGSLESLFAGKPAERALFEHARRCIESVGPHRMEVTKTQVSFMRERGFAWIWLPLPRRRPPGSIVLSFALGTRVEDLRIAEAVEPYPGRWIHHIVLEKEADLNAKVRGWLSEAYAFGVKANRRP